VTQLSSLVGASTVVQADGNMTVTIGNGQSLVVGTRAFQLTTVNSAEVPEQTDVAYVAGNSTVALTPQTLSGGSLGALLAFRAGALTESRNELGRIAAGIAETFNAQHVLGQDLNGALGTNFFTAPVGSATANTANTGNAVLNVAIVGASALTASDYRLVYTGAAYQLTRLSDGTQTSYATLPQTVDGITLQVASGSMNAGDSFYVEPTRYTARNLSVAISDPTKIAAAAPMRTGAGANMGTGAISAGVVNPPVNANLQQPVTITFTSATTFSVTGVGTGNPVGVAFTAGQPITYNGWTVSISGAPQTGDTFTVGPNNNGVSDNRNAALLADLQSKPILSGSTATYQQTYAQLASSVGSQTRDMQIAADAQEAIATRAKETQQSMSGVNLDEEAANLMRYQQAYQAAGKVIQVASTLFDTILGIRS
jgi:flagellar hook-associated protein 1 FlgK